MAVFSCVFNPEIPGNFQLNKMIFSKYFFGLVTIAGGHEDFVVMIADFHI